MEKMEKINPEALIIVEDVEEEFPIIVDPTYSKSMHPDNSFGQLYRPEAKISSHKDTLVIMLLASKILNEEYGYKLKINDSLRTVEGQEGMARYLKTHSVGGFNNLTDLNISDELVSTPGAGSHPRGMAIDVQMVDSEGNLVDCGTGFDSFIYDAEPTTDNNKACRAFDFTKTETPEKAAEIKANREKLDKAIFKSCELLGIEGFVGLPDEWWDYRYPSSISTKYEPLREKDLPKHMRLTSGSEKYPEVPFDEALYQKNVEDICNAANDGFKTFLKEKASKSKPFTRQNTL